MTEKSAIKFEPSQGGLNYVLEEDSKCSEMITHFKVDADKVLKPLFENPSDKSSDTNCSHCGKEFADFVFLTRHIKLHHKPHMCDICGISFGTYFKARYHKIMIHTELKHKCSHCSKLFVRKKEQLIHSSQCEKKRFPCEICHQKFKDSKNVVLHMKRFHHDKGTPKKVQNDRLPSNEMKELRQTEKITVKPEVIVEEATSISEEILQPFVQNSLRSNNQQEQTQSEEITLKMEITVEETTLFPHDDFEISRPNTSTITEDTDNNIPEKESEVINFASLKSMADEKNSQLLVEDLSCGISETKCFHCGKEFPGVNYLTRHIELSHQPYPCNVCGITLSSYGQSRYHKLKAHTEPKHKCPHCPRKFHLKFNYQKHLLVCVGRRIRCEFCDKTFKNLHCAYNHKKRFHQDDKASRKTQIDLTCCDEQKVENQAEHFAVKDEISAEETASNPFNFIDCPICGENVGDQKQVSHHVETIHQMTMCTSCGMTFTSVDQLIDHKLTCPQHLKQVDSQFSSEAQNAETALSGLCDTVCPHCDKDCFHAALLARHIAWCHQPVACATCGDTVSSKSRMKYHKMKHHSEPKFKCAHCPKKFHLKGNYMRHVPTHGKKGKFACKFCGHMCKNALGVKKHMRSKHSLKEYQSDCTNRNELDQEHQPCDDVNLLQGENMELKMEIKEEETLLKEQHYQTPDEDCENSPTDTVTSVSQFKAHKLKNSFAVKDQMKRTHKSKEYQTDRTNCDELDQEPLPCDDVNLIQEENMELQMEIKVEETKLQEQSNQAIDEDCGKSTTATIISANQLEARKIEHRVNPKFSCKKCHQKFHGIKAFQRHVNKHMNKTDRNECDVSQEAKFKIKTCSICGATFGSRRKWEYHKRVSHRERKYKCSLCPLTFHFGYLLRRHETNLHTELVCNKCNLKFASHNKLNYHKRVAHTDLKYKCSQCPKMFHSISNLCPERFPDESSLQRHIANVHPPSEMSCEKCHLTFTTRYKLLYHMKKIHAERKPGFKCPDCGKLYNFQYALRHHMVVHSKAKKKIVRESSGISEQQTEHDLKKNQYSSLQNVASECLDHVNETEIKEDQPKACSICGLIFENKHRLVYHKKKAHTEPKHKCSNCLKMFHSIFELHRHETTHSKTLEENVVCKLCPKTFQGEISLQRHVKRTHPPSELPCGLCDLKFATHFKLFYHVNTIHKPRFKCPECDKPFVRQDALQNHMAAIHPKSKEEKHSIDSSERQR